MRILVSFQSLDLDETDLDEIYQVNSAKSRCKGSAISVGYGPTSPCGDSSTGGELFRQCILEGSKTTSSPPEATPFLGRGGLLHSSPGRVLRAKERKDKEVKRVKG